MALSDQAHRELLWKLYDEHKTALVWILNSASQDIGEEFSDEMLQDLQVFAAEGRTNG